MVIPRLRRLGRGVRHAQRYKEVAAILVRYGFGDLVHRASRDQALGMERPDGGGLEVQGGSRAERVRMMIEELGPTFVKLGQILSMRPDLVAAEYRHQLSRLQEEVPPFPGAQARGIVEEELGRPIEELYGQFDDEPFAAASLGQVHGALSLDGEPLAVKVQRPEIVQKIRTDLEIVLHLAGFLEDRVQDFAVQHPTRVVEELARTLNRELDYTVEASHTERFARQFAGDERIKVPGVHRDLTTARVLTMERIHGQRPDDVEALEAAGLQPELIARRGTDLIMEQIFVHRFFHADPHSGNIRILPEGVICYLDYGMMGRLDGHASDDFADLVLAIADQDPAAATAALVGLTGGDDLGEKGLLERDVADLMDHYFYRPLKEMRVGALLQDLITKLTHHGLSLPPDLYLMFKALGTVEGIGRTLDPEFDLMRQAAPFLRRVVLARWHPARLGREIGSSGLEFGRLLRDLPGELRALIRSAHGGKLKVPLQLLALDDAMLSLERVGNRLSFAIVLAALVVGSAIVLVSGLPPRLFGMPAIGLIGFISAAIMALLLLASILRHGKM